VQLGLTAGGCGCDCVTVVEINIGHTVTLIRLIRISDPTDQED